MSSSGYRDEPDAGADCVRDAIAAIRCGTTGDHVGMHAVLNGTESPRQVAAALALITAGIFVSGGMDQASIHALLSSLTATANDFPLGQLRLPQKGVSSHRWRVRNCDSLR
ncbi:MAG TPA: hypothetical protein VG142_11850 [Trebonia sp.]|nr:hypothetical protein [Trebonia sp.]